MRAHTGPAALAHGLIRGEDLARDAVALEDARGATPIVGRIDSASAATRSSSVKRGAAAISVCSTSGLYVARRGRRWDRPRRRARSPWTGRGAACRGRCPRARAPSCWRWRLGAGCCASAPRWRGCRRDGRGATRVEASPVWPPTSREIASARPRTIGGSPDGHGHDPFPRAATRRVSASTICRMSSIKPGGGQRWPSELEAALAVHVGMAVDEPGHGEAAAEVHAPRGRDRRAALSSVVSAQGGDAPAADGEGLNPGSAREGAVRIVPPVSTRSAEVMARIQPLPPRALATRRGAVRSVSRRPRAGGRGAERASSGSARPGRGSLWLCHDQARLGAVGGADQSRRSPRRRACLRRSRSP